MLSTHRDLKLSPISADKTGIFLSPHVSICAHGFTDLSAIRLTLNFLS